MKVLVTGASGYLGQHLLGTLLEDASLSVYAAYGSLETFPEDFPKASCISVDLQAADKVVLNKVDLLACDDDAQALRQHVQRAAPWAEVLTATHAEHVPHACIHMCMTSDPRLRGA